jgi:hypothetical protein
MPRWCSDGHLRIHQRLLQSTSPTFSARLEKPCRFRTQGSLNEHLKRHESVAGPSTSWSGFMPLTELFCTQTSVRKIWGLEASVYRKTILTLVRKSPRCALWKHATHVLGSIPRPRGSHEYPAPFGSHHWDGEAVDGRRYPDR